ncbi:diacylglycerol/lipid kinase family protein [Nanoarchaeota archaeon]
MSKTLYIINPAGNGGAGPRIWGQFKELWTGPIDEKDVFMTKYPGHATEIAKDAKGYDIIVAVGGDGTVNEVMTGTLNNPEKPALALLPAGTGNDIGRNVGIKSLNHAVEALKKSKPKKYDILEVEYGKVKKYSFLCIGFGMSANHRVRPWMKKYLGAAMGYYLATFLELILFKPWNMTIKWDGGKYKDRTTFVIVANVEKTSGGSMMLGPGAKPTDGMMTVTIVPFKSKFNCFFKEFPKLPKGKVTAIPGVRFFRTKKIKIVSTPRTDMDIDGDPIGTTPATVKILPKKIKIISLVK